MQKIEEILKASKVSYVNIGTWLEFQEKGLIVRMLGDEIANPHNYEVITITQEEYVDRFSQVMNLIKSKLNITLTRVYARNCKTEIITDKKLVNDFMEKYHIQGKSQFRIAIGLFYNSSLVGIMTGNRHHRNNDSSSFVLNRLVFMDNVQVVGGASKLLVKLIDYTNQNGYSELISWSDNRYSIGRVYKALGFIKTANLRSDYSYLTPSGEIQSKQMNQKKYLVKKGAIGNTEREMAESLGYKRIYDCGKIRWTIFLT
jgi:L-amino acid N-acyltransferase YncA